MNPLHFIQQLFAHQQQTQAHPQSHPQQAAPHQNTYSAAQMAQMIPVGQPIPKAFMDSFSPQTRALAQIYQNNPQDPRVAHLDPKMFGYAPDNTMMHPAVQAMLLHSLNRPGLQMPGNLPFGGLQGGYDQAAQPLRPGQIPFNQSDFRDTNIGF